MAKAERFATPRTPALPSSCVARLRCKYSHTLTERDSDLYAEEIDLRELLNHTEETEARLALAVRVCEAFTRYRRNADSNVHFPAQDGPRDRANFRVLVAAHDTYLAGVRWRGLQGAVKGGD